MVPLTACKTSHRAAPARMPRRPGARRHAALLLVALLAVVAVPAHAQLRLPGGVPRLPSVPELPRTPPLVIDPQLPAVPLGEPRARLVDDLLRRHADEVEADPRGEPMRRAELVLLSPSPATLDAARAAGYTVLRERVLEGLGETSVVLRAPPGAPTADALRRLRAIDPNLQADFNHLYLPGGATGEASAAPPALPIAPIARSVRVGLVDGGIDVSHPALRAAKVAAFGCERPAPSAHGTAVASLLVGADGDFHGIVPAAALHTADVFCGRPVGGSVEAVADAFAWLARERVAVVNVSLVGPPNLVLERAVQALVARGHLVVAAVGNDGPAAPPLYPAAYAGVIGVTGVNAARHVLPEAAQGPQVMFAAPGADIAAAQAGTRGYVAVRGTSFAAPVVAGLLAERLPEPGAAEAARAVRALVEMAVDLGAPGRDSVFGEGLVGEWARIEPARVHASRDLHASP
jgi:hypothetical protein